MTGQSPGPRKASRVDGACSQWFLLHCIPSATRQIPKPSFVACGAKIMVTVLLRGVTD